ADCFPSADSIKPEAAVFSVLSRKPPLLHVCFSPAQHCSELQKLEKQQRDIGRKLFPNGNWPASDVPCVRAVSRPHNGKKRRLAVQTVASLSISKLRLDGSRLAVMHANDDSLGVRSASVSGSDAEGRPFESPPVCQTDFLHLAALQSCAQVLGSVQR